ncbi:MAG: zinc ribbon domain-containing protein [Muribaculaceae bacterium]|nr:zinc ribbon domain-containing protein [Muribaculaceae bacterium]
MEKFCTKCGNPLDSGEKFCGNCGAPLDVTAVPQAGIQNSAAAQSRTVKDSASDQNKRRNYAATLQNPQKAILSGLLFAIFLTIFSFVWEICNELVIWKLPFSSQEFFMLPYPLHFDISKFFTIFVIAWLGWSIPMYFVTQKNYNKIQTDKKDKEEEITILQNKIEVLERSIDQINNTKDRL